MMDWTVAFLLYLFTRLDALHNLATAGLFISVFSICSVVFFTIIEDINLPRDLVTKFVIAIGVFISMLIAIPSQKDMALIVGGAIGYEQASRLVSDERFQRLSDNSLKALEMWVEEQTKEKQND